jgi:hypothetical protein
LRGQSSACATTVDAIKAKMAAFNTFTTLSRPLISRTAFFRLHQALRIG